MASMEYVVVIVDVGETMAAGRTAEGSYIDSAVNAVDALVREKLLFAPKHEMGYVLVGTKETENEMYDESMPGEYEHITVARTIVQPDLEFLRDVIDTRADGAQADVLDALWVAARLLEERVNAMKRRNKNLKQRVFLVTDAGCRLNSAGATDLADKFRDNGIALNVFGINFADEECYLPADDEDHTPDTRDPPVSVIKRTNEKFLYDFCESIHGACFPIQDAAELLNRFRKRGRLQRSTYNGTLKLGNALDIPVQCYTLTYEEKFPTLKKKSAPAAAADGPTCDVVGETQYVLVNDPDTVIDKEDRIESYRYGKTLVPFDAVVKELMAYNTERSMHVIGFLPRDGVPRHLFMKSTDCIAAKKDDLPQTQQTLSALAHAMIETGHVALCRFVKRKNATPYVGVLFPVVTAEKECFYFTVLPFGDDMREYAFAPLLDEQHGGIKRSTNPVDDCTAPQPSAEQQAVAEQLVRSLDLMTAGVNHDTGEPGEALFPSDTYNPVLQRFYQCVQHRALNPNEPLPPVEARIMAYVQPDEKLFEGARAPIENFRRAFPMVEVEDKAGASKRKFFKDLSEVGVTLDNYTREAGDGGGGGGDGGGGKKKRRLDDGGVPVGLDTLVAGETKTVGTTHPVEDFTAMLENRNADLLESALTQMQDVIKRLVNQSVRDAQYEKAYECVAALRKTCVLESSGAVFNAFLREMRSLYKDKRRNDFWEEYISGNAVSLVVDADDNVSQQEADNFHNPAAEAETPAAQTNNDSDSDDVEDLFDEM